jgi:feruloyl esterase
VGRQLSRANPKWGAAGAFAALITLALFWSGGAGSAAETVGGGQGGTVGGGLACDKAAIQAVAPADTTIVSAEVMQSPVPHCRVEGYVTTTNPGPNRDNFRLQLPDRSFWKDRYYFIGMGGSAGYVPTDSQIPYGNPMKMGFAVAGTDTGHQAPILDWSFLSDPAKAVDHIHRGAHVVAVATQQITRAYYGVDKIWRYHAGCSGGGRMGMEAIQRHPEDYDGILLGWPGGRLPPGHDGLFVSMVREMTREPGSWLSPAKLKFAEAKVMAACDAIDSAVDDMIWDHKKCQYDFNKLRCRGADKPDCLTVPEITSINNLLRDTEMPISNMGMWSTFLGSTPPPWSPDTSMENASKTSAALVIETTWARTDLNEPDRDIVKNPLTPAELATMAKVQRQIGFNAVQSPDLSGYANGGGKAIFFVGVSDPCCSNIGVENFIGDVKGAMGADRVEQFVRLYEIPGAGHCGGGTGPADPADQLLRALVDWVEQGKAPAGVVMHRGADRAQMAFSDPNDATSGVRIPAPSGPSRDFLVCPQPMVSVFDRSKAGFPGAVNEAANWSCQRPTT